MVIVLPNRDCLVQHWLYSRGNINMTKKMTIEEAIDRIREAVEYYDMVHDTGEEKQTLKNKDYVWKGYDRLMEISNED